MKKFFMGGLWVAVGLFSLLVFGSLFSLIGSSFIGAKQMQTKEDIQALRPTALSPHGEVAQAFSMFSPLTSVQQDALERELVGKIVEWSLPLEDVQVLSDTIEVHSSTSLANTISITCTIHDPSPDLINFVEALVPGDRFTCKGAIKKRTWVGGVEINPAVIIKN